MGGGCCVGLGEHGCPQGTGDADRACQTSSRVECRDRGPSPPGWHSSLMKRSHKSQLAPRPTLGTHQGPRRQPPPPLGAGWPQNGETPVGAYPQCSGLTRGRTVCKPGFSLQPWLGTHCPALAGEEMGMLPRGHMPSNCSQLPFIPV